MDRTSIINKIGNKYHTPNIEGGEYSYVQEAGSRINLEKALGKSFNHFKLDIRFELDNVVVLIETKQSFTTKDEKQLAEYVAEEKALHTGKKIIAMLANTTNDDIKVWKSVVNDYHILDTETVIDTMEHYVSLFDVNKQNNREKVLKNTYALNELLHKKDIDEKLRSQFVGTILLHIKKKVEDFGIPSVDDELIQKMKDYISVLSESAIRSDIADTLSNLLDGSENKNKKIELLQNNVLKNQKVRALKKLIGKKYLTPFSQIFSNISIPKVPKDKTYLIFSLLPLTNTQAKQTRIKHLLRTISQNLCVVLLT